MRIFTLWSTHFVFFCHNQQLTSFPSPLCVLNLHVWLCVHLPGARTPSCGHSRHPPGWHCFQGPTNALRVVWPFLLTAEKPGCAWHPANHFTGGIYHPSWSKPKYCYFTSSTCFVSKPREIYQAIHPERRLIIWDLFLRAGRVNLHN